MTQVDFYILDEQAQGDRYGLACRIAEKAWQQGWRVYLHTNYPAESRHLDKLLWTFREGSFLPHALTTEADPGLNPVLIGDSADSGDEHDVLINLATEVPIFFAKFERVAELIDHDPQIKQEGRQRFRFYRDRGYSLNTHNIKQ
ncbi:DNA polymerase III subunit chi [Solemya velesiana gill symbiont]|uniref:DNA polymerase III subunit chi n=1 Tax=Solemya velesiana gill symbiont TaxID=1918948 RepID=A0A1T2KVP9_9GAMM|nr:DNA polymerase III subunit chi [Solemya velesiana gill symbiont]OOZ36806.1 DNA polymerase III subunit chi [Solemya velesiana gill symbiont]